MTPRAAVAVAGRSTTTRAFAVAAMALGIALLVVLVAPRQLRAQGGAPNDWAPVAARAIARGRVLTADDIARDTSRRANVADSVTAGWVARRVIAPGEALRAPAVAPRPLIAAGSPVTVVYRGSGLALTLRGTALGDAPLGGRVLVRVDATRRVEGVAAAAGVVELPRVD